jgi:hypothetical protein
MLPAKLGSEKADRVISDGWTDNGLTYRATSPVMGRAI